MAAMSTAPLVLRQATLPAVWDRDEAGKRKYKPRKCFLLRLPIELLELVCTHLSCDALAKASLVCRKLRAPAQARLLEQIHLSAVGGFTSPTVARLASRIDFMCDRNISCQSLSFNRLQGDQAHWSRVAPLLSQAPRRRKFRRLKLKRVDAGWIQPIWTFCQASIPPLHSIELSQMPLAALLSLVESGVKTDRILFSRFPELKLEEADAEYLEDGQKREALCLLASTDDDLEIRWDGAFDETALRPGFPPLGFILGARSLSLSCDLVPHIYRAMRRGDFTLPLNSIRVRNLQIRRNDNDAHEDEDLCAWEDEDLEFQFRFLSLLPACMEASLPPGIPPDVLHKSRPQWRACQSQALPESLGILRMETGARDCEDLSLTLGAFRGWTAKHKHRLREVHLFLNWEIFDRVTEEAMPIWDGRDIEQLAEEEPESVLRYPWDPAGGREEDLEIYERLTERLKEAWRSSLKHALYSLETSLQRRGIAFHLSST